MFKTVEGESKGILLEKRSKFIANMIGVSNKEEAEEFIGLMRRRYDNARHNCYAYRVFDEDEIFEKQNDDGEPSGTAGAPILNVLNKMEFVNIVVVVTRYFGGTLLGTGGLIKAYSEVTKRAIENAKAVNKEKGYVVEITDDYERMKEFLYFCEKNKLKIISREYTDKINYLIEISETKFVELCRKNKKSFFHNLPIKIVEKKNIANIE